MSYPVLFAVDRPMRFERVQVVLRLAILIVLGVIGVPTGLIGTIVYLLLPVVAAVQISQKGATRYQSEDGPWIVRTLTWLLAIQAYLGLLVDRVPTREPEKLVRFEVRHSGQPSTGDALLRLILTIPHAFVLALLGIAGGIAWIVALVLVLVHEEYPVSIHRFLCGILRWQARVLGYHAALVEGYPPFEFDAGAAEPLKA